MRLYIDGYRTQNKKLIDILTDAAFYYCAALLGTRMVNSKNLIVDIKLTNGLKKKENVYGYCHIIGNLSRPREFCIELDADTKFDMKQLLTWLAHEFVHLRQFFRMELYDYVDGTTQWKTKRYKINSRSDLEAPWEKEAYRLESKLADEFVERYYE